MYPKCDHAWCVGQEECITPNHPQEIYKALKEMTASKEEVEDKKDREMGRKLKYQ